MGSDLRLTGLGSGTDMDAIIAKLMAVERRPVAALQKRQLDLEAKRDVWRDVHSRLANLRTKAIDLKLPSTFNAKKVVSGDDKVVAATVTADAIVANYSIKVEDLAQAHSVRSATQTSAIAALGLNAGDITVGEKSDGSAATVSISANDSLNSIAEKINKTSSTVLASVVTVATNDVRLVLKSKNTGVEYAMNHASGNTGNVANGTSDALTALGVLNGAGTAFVDEATAAADSKVRIDGLLIQRSTNTISDTITGLTLDLKAKSASDGGGGFLATTLTVSANTSTAVKAVNGFVEQFNSVQSFISSKMTKDPVTGKAGILQGDPTASTILGNVRRMVTGKVAGMIDKKYDSLSQIGITTGAWSSADRDKLVFDSSKFTKAMEEDPALVAELFGAQVSNVALTTNGATAGASTTASGFNAADLLNGQTSSASWGSAGGGWQGNTVGGTDYVDITFSESKTIDKIKIHTLNSDTQPAASFGVRDFDIQYWANGTWNTIKSVTNNTNAIYTEDFSALTTDKIRIDVKDVNTDGIDPKYARLVEVEVFQKNFGAASQLDEYLLNLTKTDGTVTSARTVLDKQVQSTKDRITKMELRLKEKEERLINRFAKLETALGKLNRQGSWIQSQLNALMG